MTTDFKVNNFDLLRIFAASQVVLAHTIEHLKIPTAPWIVTLVNAFPGVPIFFVVSGFLISAAYERSPSLGSYFRNRALRIFPGLWCCIFATIVIATLFGYSFISVKGGVWLISQLAGGIYTPGFLKSFGFGSYNGSLWTIPIELQFYALLPLLYRPWLKDRSNTVAMLWIIWMAFSAIALLASFITPQLIELADEPLPNKLFRYSFVPHFYLFLTGVLLRWLRAYDSRWIAGKGVYWLAAYLAYYYLVPSSVVRDFAGMLLLGVTAVVLAYTAPTSARMLLRGHDISYGVYIYHGLLLNIFVQLGLMYRGFYVAVIAACTYVAGYLSWILVERRFMRRKKAAFR
jgi:peptidoglycan/LPS O-acetylase OafA/YrhL